MREAEPSNGDATPAQYAVRGVGQSALPACSPPPAHFAPARRRLLFPWQPRRTDATAPLVDTLVGVNSSQKLSRGNLPLGGPAQRSPELAPRRIHPLFVLHASVPLSVLPIFIPTLRYVASDQVLNDCSRSLPICKVE